MHKPVYNNVLYAEIHTNTQTHKPMDTWAPNGVRILLGALFFTITTLSRRTENRTFRFARSLQKLKNTTTTPNTIDTPDGGSRTRRRRCCCGSRRKTFSRELCEDRTFSARLKRDAFELGLTRKPSRKMPRPCRWWLTAAERCKHIHAQSEKERETEHTLTLTCSQARARRGCAGPIVRPRRDVHARQFVGGEIVE